MTEWRITLPYRDRSDPVADIAAAAGALADRQEREIVRSLTLELATTSGIATVGDALDALADASPPARRALLDRARARAGLRATEAEEQHVAYEAANRGITSSLPPRDSSGRIEARCSGPTCLQYRPHPSFPGAAEKVDQKRWFCPEHEDLAEPGDLEPYTGPRLAYNRVGLVVDLDEHEAEAERQRIRAESRRRQREAREAERAVEGAALARTEEAERERFRRESITGAP